MKTLRLFFLIVAFSCLSCEDIIEVDSYSTIPVAGFPANVDEAEAILIGSYDKVRDYMNTTTYFEDRGDSFEVGVIGGPSDAYNQNLFPGNAPTWQEYYSALQNINILIAEVPHLSTDDPKAQKILAEAYFLRAFTYFVMARIWGDVPLVLEPTRSSLTDFQGRAPVDEIFDQINADIQKSLENFRSDAIPNKYRASRPAASALLANVNVWTGKVLGGGQEDFITAVDAIEAVENSGVSLLTDFGDIFDNKRNNEIIFALPFDLDEQAGMYARIVSAKEGDIGSANLDLNPNLPISVGNTSRHVYTPSEQVRDLFADQNDQRRERSFLPILTGNPENPDIRSYHQTKFRGTVFNAEREYDDDIIVYRLGGLLLLKAEAYAALNELENAVAALNRIRNRAGIGNYEGPMNKEAIEREILDERGRELFLELKRWNDLVRFHHAGTIDIYDYVPQLNGKNIPLYWPISDEVIVLNENIEQTEGY